MYILSPKFHYKGLICVPMIKHGYPHMTEVTLVGEGIMSLIYNSTSFMLLVIDQSAKVQSTLSLDNIQRMYVYVYVLFNT